MDWADPSDPDDVRPDRLDALSLAPVADPPRPAAVDELDAVAVNGGCELLALDVRDPRGTLDDPDMGIHGVVTASRFLRWVLQSEAANEALPALATTGGFGGRHGQHRGEHSDPEFEWCHSLTVDGHVAWLLVRGGAYDDFAGTHAEAKDLGREFVDALFGDRYEDVTVRRSTDQWSDWFVLTPHWDETLYLYDARDHRVWLLLLSDTD